MYHNVPAFPSPVKLPDSYSRFSIKVKKSTSTLVSMTYSFPEALERCGGSGLLNSDEMQVALLQLSSQTRPRHHSMPRRKQSGTMMTIPKGSSWEKTPNSQVLSLLSIPIQF